MNISLEIQTNDAPALLAAVAGNLPARGDKIAISDDIALRYIGTETYRGADPTAIILFALSFPVGIATNVIADIISNHLRRKSTKAAHMGQARLVVTRETEQIGADGTRIITESTTYQTIINNSTFAPLWSAGDHDGRWPTAPRPGVRACVTAGGPGTRAPAKSVSTP
jgi:hypothetical protein